MTKTTRALIFINLAVCLLGFTGLFAKWIALPASAVTLGRALVSTIALFAFCRLRKQEIRITSRKTVLLLAAAGALLAVHWTTFVLSVDLSTVAIGTITYSTFPLLITFFEPIFFREKLLARNILTALLIIAGVIITIPEFSFESGTFLGIAVGMVSSLAFASLTLLNRRFASGTRPSTVIALYEQGFAALAVLPFVFFTEMHPTLPDLGLLVLLGLFMTATAHTLFIFALQKLTARTVGVISALETVYGILFALFFIGEIPSLREVIGGAVIVGTVVVSQLTAKVPSRKVQPERVIKEPTKLHACE